MIKNIATILFCVLLVMACAFSVEAEGAISEQEIYSQFREANELFDQ